MDFSSLSGVEWTSHLSEITDVGITDVGRT